MAPSGPMAPILAGTPCRPHDQPHAHRAGRVKAAAERSDVAQSASLEAARTMSNLAPRKRQLLIRSLPRRGRGSRAGRSGRAAWAVFRLMTSSNLSGCSTGPVARPRFPQNVACGDRREEPKVCRLSAGVRFAREVRGRLFAGGSRIRTIGSAGGGRHPRNIGSRLRPLFRV